MSNLAITNTTKHACNTDNCFRTCTIGCSICKFYYCSAKCQKQDWPVHKITCAARKCDRLRKYVQYELQDKFRPPNLLLISLGASTPVFDRWDIGMRVLGHARALSSGSPITSVCVFCQTKIHFTKANERSFRFMLENYTVIGDRCETCFRKGIKIIPKSYMTLTETKLYLLCCIREFKVCRDIRQLLCSYLTYDPKDYLPETSIKDFRQQLQDRHIRLDNH